MLKKYHKRRPKPETTDDLERAATKTYQQGGGELHQAFDCLHGYGCQWGSL